MELDLKHIAPLVQKQFPAFYQEEGENFIQFIKAYYEWMDQQGPLYKSRRLSEYGSIDQTSEEYLDYFLNKFMKGIPKKIVSDKRLLEKHILDVYRSKGSVEGLKLLFRLIYNLEVNVFLPKTEMLKPSDGKWKRNAYIEVEERPYNYSYSKKNIKGTLSGATAFVTTSARVDTGYNLSHVLYLSDIKPSNSGVGFIVGENVVYDGLNPNEATKIIGSATQASIIRSSENHEPGDRLLTTNTTGEGLIFDVATILDKDAARGYISFKLVDGGYGYAIDTPVKISYKTASSGSGATFKVKSLANTTTFTYNINFLKSSNAPDGNSFVNTLISANDYGASMLFSNVDSIIDNGLSYQNITIGSIATLGAVTSGDHEYNGSVQPFVFEKRVHGYGILDKNGAIWGNNAIITGELATGNGVISSVELLSSGFGFNTEGERILFYNETDQLKNVELTLSLGAVGYEEGYWTDDSGLLNSDMYITDSDYYQDFSYEIQMEKSLDKYINVLKQIMHPVGNRVFGKPIIIDSKESRESILVETLTVHT